MSDRGHGVMLFEPLGQGGIAHYTFCLARALAPRIPCHIATNADYELTEACARAHVPAHRMMFARTARLIAKVPWLSKQTPAPAWTRRVLKAVEYPLDALRLLVLCRRLRCDVLHCQGIHLLNFALLLAARLLGLRIIYTAHNVLPHQARWYHRVLYRLAYRIPHCIIVHAETSREEVRALGGRERAVAVIPHGHYGFLLEQADWTPAEARRHLGLNGAATVLLAFGAIRPDKGLDVLLDAIAQGRADLGTFVLVVAGIPQQRMEPYEAQLDRLGLRDVVRLDLRYIEMPDVPAYFAAADVAVLPYRTISHSGVCHLAYAAGVPVVATAVGGFRELVEHERTGLLVPANDPAALAEALVRIVQDEPLRGRLGRGAREVAQTKYAWDRIADRTLALYQGAV